MMFIRNKNSLLRPSSFSIKVRDEYVKAKEVYIKENGVYLEMLRSLEPVMAVITPKQRDEAERRIAIEAEFRSSTDYIIIDWGDGSPRVTLNQNNKLAVHTYECKEYFHTLVAVGECKSFAISGRALLALESFGSMRNEAFSFCCQGVLEPSLNLQAVPRILPKYITNLDHAFAYTQNLDDTLSDWDVSHVTSMAGMFANAKDIPEISFWEVSNVGDMTGMFANAIDFDQDLSLWNLPLIEGMPARFDENTLSWLKEDRQPQFGS